ncbi:ArsR/SmtB family transcription factor [Nocardioides ungokensis]|uniref:ArsR/SmtB family transcription factor n=1 Tax=Nocardioides ungokensis TaxID=1643322 RepID=UPI001C60F532|nr:helix-turn-helix domain-containing protein [Nocardioides ungokensis]
MSPAPQAAATTRPDDVLPVAGLLEVLEALADPVRLEMVRRLDPDGTPAPCAALYDGVGKSTASHHFKILREAGSSSAAWSAARPTTPCGSTRSRIGTPACCAASWPAATDPSWFDRSNIGYRSAGP